MLVAFGAFWMLVNGTASSFFSNDVTHIPSVILVVIGICTAWLGWTSWIADSYLSDETNAYYELTTKKQIERNLEWNWFLSDFIMGIGLFGTVIGCIMLFSVNLGGNVADVGKVINELYRSLSVAFFSTAVAVFGNLFVKIQTMNVQQAMNDSEQ